MSKSTSTAKNTKSQIAVGDTSYDRIDAGAAYPEDFYVVTDPTHPLYREPRDKPLSRESIDSIKLLGVIVPIECKEIIVKGQKKLAIVFGVDRRAMAEIAFRELKAEGKPFPGAPRSASSTGRIPFILRNDLTDEECRYHISVENERRRQTVEESLAHRIAAAQRIYTEMEAQARARREKFQTTAAINRICTIFSITPSTWARWDALTKLPAATQAYFYGDNPPPLSLVDTLSRMDRSEHEAACHRVLAAEVTTTQSVNKLTEDLPQAPVAPSGGARTRTRPTGAVNEDGTRRLYPPRAAKLTDGIAIAKQKVEEIRSMPVDKGLVALFQLVEDVLRFVVGEPVKELVSKKTKARRKPPVNAANSAPSTSKITPEVLKAAYEAQIAGKTDVRTEPGRQAYDRHVSEVLASKDASHRWTLEEVSAAVGGSKANASSSLTRLTEQGLVKHEGNTRKLRYFLASDTGAEDPEDENEDEDQEEDESDEDDAESDEDDAETDEDDAETDENGDEETDSSAAEDEPHSNRRRVELDDDVRSDEPDMRQMRVF